MARLRARARENLLIYRGASYNTDLLQEATRLLDFLSDYEAAGLKLRGTSLKIITGSFKFPKQCEAKQWIAKQEKKKNLGSQNRLCF